MDIGFAATTTLDSRYAELDRPVLLSGTQALVRVMLEQARLDRAAGLNTGGLVSGYRGSPLGGLDQELWRRAELLDAAGVRFQPGLNEDLAATMLWGTQQVDTFPGARVDGVFGLWYGKGPGVDRSGDAFRCANMIGTSRLGGVLAVSGDDHAAHSSVFPHSTDGIFESVLIPVLQPADVQEIVEYGLAGLALSRYAGALGGAEDHRRDGRAVGRRDHRLRTALRHPESGSAAARPQPRPPPRLARRTCRSSSAGCWRNACPRHSPGCGRTGWTGWRTGRRRRRSAS